MRNVDEEVIDKLSEFRDDWYNGLTENSSRDLYNDLLERFYDSIEDQVYWTFSHVDTEELPWLP